MKIVPLTTNLNETQKRPYFLWDEPLTVEKLHEILSSGDCKLKPSVSEVNAKPKACVSEANMDKRLNYMAKILREARFEHVWEFLSVQDLLANWERLKGRLGRKKAFWEFFLRKWKEHGLI
ncbi:TPA: hypothetical protein EYP66_21925 [Candidatus Poribacteria bacterium]|nr:hypothetical protein [Candidatus Poribacteria bacterium]